MKAYEKQRGSVTLETSIVLPIFYFPVFIHIWLILRNRCTEPNDARTCAVNEELVFGFISYGKC